MSIEAKIKNSQLLTDIFGHWPSFHDAEVLEINLRRGTSDHVGQATLQAAIRVFEMTSEITERGAYKLRNQSLARLSFLDIVQVDLTDFNNQNALFGLHIIDISSHQLERVKYQVTFDAAHGVNLRFQCFGIAVDSVIPWHPQDY